MKEENFIISVCEEIISNFDDDELISHNWLKEKLGLKPILLEDYDNFQDALKAGQEQQIQYMEMIKDIKKEMLESFSCCIKNVWSDGYKILPPKEQVEYGLDRFKNKENKLIKETNLIITNVRRVDKSQQATDNDKRSDFARFTMMIKDFLKKKSKRNAD